VKLAIYKSRVRVLAAGRYRVVALGKLFTPVCLCHQVVSFGTGRGAVMLIGWESNRGDLRESRVYD